MKKLLKTLSDALDIILGNKYIVLAIIIGLGVMYLPTYSCGKSSADKAMETYKRQLSGQLTEKEQQLQAANNELGVMKSELLSRDELAKRAAQEKEEVSKEFEEFKKEHNLQIKSKDRAIARLEQKIKNGSSSVDVGGDLELCTAENIRKCTISYSWQDDYGRFKLRDDNIFDNKSEFTASQMFKVYGEIYEQQDGSLQTRRLVLREVHQKDDGTYEDIPDAKAEIVESKFEYHNPPEVKVEWEWTDLFRLRGIAVGGVEALPNSGHLTFGLGIEFMTFYGFGLGSFTSLDFQNPENIAQHISLQYNPTIMDTELNLGVFVSVGTPFARFFNDYQFSTGLVFYLNN